MVQFIVMAGTFVLVEFAFEYLLASLAQRISPLLARLGQTFNRGCGGLFIAMGLALPMSY